MEHLPQLLLAWSILAVGVVSPGPSVMLIVGVALNRGRWPSVLVALGVACGTVVLCTATVAGIAAIVAQIAWAATALRLVGAAYLLWLAVKAFRNAVHPPALAPPTSGRADALRTAASGFALQVTNPKAVMFWLAIASVGGVGSAPPTAVALFIAGSFLISFVGHGAYGILLSAAPVRRAYERFRRPIEALFGGLFLVASARLALVRS